MPPAMPCGRCGGCGICRLIRTYPHKPYGSKWGVTAADFGGPVPSAVPNTPRPIPTAPTPARPPCRHELPVVTWCPLKDPRLDVRGCGLHDQCVRGPARSDHRQCVACPDYAPEPS